MALRKIDAFWDSEDHFQYTAVDDVQPGILIRYDYTTKLGWAAWRHGSPVSIEANEVPAEVLAEFLPTMN